MYNPSHFEEKRLDVLHALVRAQPLATLVTMTADGLVANHIPLFLRVDGTPFGTLAGHVARNNPVWREFDAGVQVLAVFQGPQAYISPNWYATKQEHGKVVPTWNYAVVHAKGTLTVHDDPQWIRAQMQQLTQQQETATSDKPWAVDDAPADYLKTMVAAVVGIEIPIASLSGKWKVSQNQPAVNREGVVQALQATGDDAMVGLVQTYAPK